MVFQSPRLAPPGKYVVRSQTTDYDQKILSVRNLGVPTPNLGSAIWVRDQPKPNFSKCKKYTRVTPHFKAEGIKQKKEGVILGRCHIYSVHAPIKFQIFNDVPSFIQSKMRAIYII